MGISRASEEVEIGKRHRFDLTRSRVEPFDRHARKYEAWFSKNKYAYLSELKALRKLVPRRGLSAEIGTGSGRFALPLGVDIGIEPSPSRMTCGA